MRLLVARDDVSVNSINNAGRSLPSLAAQNGHESVVSLLMAQGDIDVDSMGVFSRSPLSLAAEKGHESVIRLLMARAGVKLDICMASRHYRSPP